MADLLSDGGPVDTASSPGGWTPDDWTNMVENGNAYALAWYSILSNRPIVPTAVAGARIPAVLPAAAPYTPTTAINSQTIMVIGVAIVAFLLLRR